MKHKHSQQLDEARETRDARAKASHKVMWKTYTRKLVSQMCLRQIGGHHISHHLRLREGLEINPRNFRFGEIINKAEIPPTTRDQDRRKGRRYVKNRWGIVAKCQHSVAT
jgi:hypothetical protein